MSITNQQLADYLKEMALSNRQMMEMFTATVDRFIEHDRSNHEEFRQAIILLQERQARHAENWKTIWKVVVLPILGAIVLAVVAVVLK